MNFFVKLPALKIKATFSLGLLLAGAVLPLRAAVPPPYLRQALADFTPGVPAGWAYTVTTEQDGRRTTERFDPGKRPKEQWHLLRIDGRAPTEQESANYQKYKASQAPGAARTTYTAADIEPFSLELIKEDAMQAEFLGGFRAQAASGDKMLGHLRLRLVVTKQPAAVSKATIELTTPYSPVLTVKMNELVASVDYSPARDGRPSLPARSTSRFVGRMLLFPVTEILTITFEDYARSP